MTFKINWEKTSLRHPLPEGMVEKMARLAYPNKQLLSHEWIAGGCANFNIKIQLQGEQSPLILRIYLRDKDAGYREQKIADLIKHTVPVPQSYTLGEMAGYHFAFTEFMPGITLRDLLLGEPRYDIGAVMQEVGVVLANITNHTFSKAGDFDNDLNIIPNTTPDIYLSFVNECLQNERVSSVLITQTIVKINHYMHKYGHLFPDGNDKHLVHADFDPANILVIQQEGAWKVSAVLDWEFAFSGSVLFDVANMLRYAHQMPPEFQAGFLEGLESRDIILPDNWRITVSLLNLLSLLDLLVRHDPQNHPHQCADIRGLIEHILQELNSISIEQPS